MSASTHTDPYLTVAQAADMLGMSTDGVYKLIGRKALPSIKLSERGTRIPIHALRAYQDKINGRRPQPQQLKPRSLDLDMLRAEFEQETGRSPEDWVAAWKADDIPDTAENATLLVNALSLRKGELRVKPRAQGVFAGPADLSERADAHLRASRFGE